MVFPAFSTSDLHSYSFQLIENMERFVILGSLSNYDNKWKYEKLAAAVHVP